MHRLVPGLVPVGDAMVKTEVSMAEPEPAPEPPPMSMESAPFRRQHQEHDQDYNRNLQGTSHETSVRKFPVSSSGVDAGN
jgi:hypothetical protein